ncbi:hypothetical protein FGO68_gene5837 [Halteria grandinella]|uniref:Poly [ADP-ribose] polymerase n=1 Tax=Halteria grandinella TaxID=5974 RepID=A0A8J8NWQ2_HALGN|nr:hypothetical protein FGO68_gene5837 [Halteria grandinella]
MACKVKYELEDIQVTQERIKLIGKRSREAKAFIKKFLEGRNLQDEQIKFKVPKHWDPLYRLNQGHCQVFTLPNTCLEYNEVLNEFQNTMLAANVIKIERIQNYILWKKYLLEATILTEKLGSKKDQKVKYLFHGTKHTKPSDIYESEQGFNIAYSNNGSWGRANYFAVNASYSCNGFKHAVGNGTYQIFFARVLLGKCIELARDSQLREPPLSIFNMQRYDSIKGRTGGSDVYMVYANAKAYPEYLITYKE